ncbi:thor [Carabus blaptoides fortunei]
MPNDYSTTPGGTIYSTTPGGTKIVYERAFLLNLRNSPISQTPPKFNIPSGLLRDMPHSPIGNHTLPTNTIDETPEQFSMEI